MWRNKIGDDDRLRCLRAARRVRVQDRRHGLSRGGGHPRAPPHRLTGLEALAADVVSQRLTVKYDAAKLTTSNIAEAVAQTGMRAWLEHEEPRPPSASPMA